MGFELDERSTLTLLEMSGAIWFLGRLAARVKKSKKRTHGHAASPKLIDRKELFLNFSRQKRTLMTVAVNFHSPGLN